MIDCLFDCSNFECEHPVTIINKIFESRDVHRDCSKIFLGSTIYQSNLVLEEIEDISPLCKEWYNLQKLLLYGHTYTHETVLASRSLINKTLKSFITCLLTCSNQTIKERFSVVVEKHINRFSSYVKPIIQLGNEHITKLVANRKNQDFGIYHYFHTYLDIHFYFVMLQKICNVSLEKLECRIQTIMKDIVFLSKKIFKKQNTEDATFICPCIKNFWLFLHILAEKISQNDIFWKNFNSVVQAEEPFFIIWLLQDVATLQSLDGNLINFGCDCGKIRPNYILMEKCLKALLVDANSETVLMTLRLVNPLINNLWKRSGRIEVYQLIWDYFSKRLNVVGCKDNNISFSSIIDVINLTDTILWCPKDCKEDFQLFVNMLIAHLRNNPTHWPKIKGRIYSQLGPNKVKDLSDVGMSHVMILFICLASIHFEELSKKSLNFLESLSKEKKKTELVWSFYAILVLHHVREGRSVENIAPRIVGMIEDVLCESSKYHLIKNFISNFEHIINFSGSKNLHQWLFIDKWLIKYLSSCYYNDLTNTLRILISVLKQVENTDFWAFWEPSFKNIIYPLLKQISTASSAPSEVGLLAGRLILLIPGLFNEAFTYFNSEIMKPKVSSEFLNVTLENYPKNFIISTSQETLALQSWVKACMLMTSSQKNFTKCIIKLDSFPIEIKSEVLYSQDPLQTLIKYFGKNITFPLQNTNITKLSETCFGECDRWISQYLQQPEKEVVVLRVYECVALAFLSCGILLYNRNKPTSPFTRLVSTLLLPTEFLFGKPLHPYVFNSVKKTWHLYFESIVKLNKSPDTFLERTLRDMIVKYIPYFSTADSPITVCLDNELTAGVILEKFCVAYFIHPTKESDANVAKALQIINQYIQSTTSITTLKLVVNKTLFGLFEAVMFHSLKNTVAAVVKSITMSPLYNQLKEEFRQVVIRVTEKHLVFSSMNYFQLMNILAKFTPSDIKGMLSDLKVKICNAEKKRGVGFDKTLRHHLENLEKCLNTV